MSRRAENMLEPCSTWAVMAWWKGLTIDERGTNRSCLPAPVLPVSVLQAEFLHEPLAVWQISTFSALQTCQRSSVLHSNFKIRVYEISVWAASEGKVDDSFEELLYSIRNWLNLKLSTYNELQIKPLAGMMGPKFDSPSQMHTYTWTSIHRMILNS